MAPNAKVAQEALAVLNIIRMCEKYHQFPLGGGLFGQDSLFVRIIQKVAIWDSQREELDRKKSQPKVPS